VNKEVGKVENDTDLVKKVSDYLTHELNEQLKKQQGTG
jgi:uncharacterized protein (DUF2164 family)